MSFKLIAIRPLTTCNTKFLKNLIPNQIYKFYNNYEFLDKDGREIKCMENYVEVSKIGYEKNYVPEDFYGSEGSKINISAIVGKNGSGKSAIVELFITFVNNLSYLHHFQVNYSGYDDIDYLRYVEKINVEIFYEIDNIIYKVSLKEDGEIIVDVLKLENDQFVRFLDDDKDLIREFFFYTNVINYSIWAYNHHEMDHFISALFHKNDAYQIPIVLNPYRSQGGTLSPEKEKELAQDRLLFNILQTNTSARRITDSLDIVYFEIKQKNEDFSQNILYREKIGESIIQISYREFKTGVDNAEQIEKILQKLYDTYDLDYSNFKSNEWEIINNYLIYKTIRIVTRYNEFQEKYFDIKNRKFFSNNFEKFLEEFSADTSHITLKIRQLLYFVKFQNELGINLNTTNIDPIIYSNNIEKIIKDNKNITIIDLVPPAIFDIELILTDDLEYSSLSSGEKQMISTVQSVLYHLINLNSVTEKDNKIKYKNVNLIFEEIELYFHPEFQKKFIKRILDGINNLNLKNINLNLLFVTHSPFILSDVPKQNVLFLEVHKETRKATPQNFKRMNTFGANITDLLADSFFINDGLIGDFAKDKINKTLNWLRIQANEKIENVAEKLEINKEIKYTADEETKSYNKRIIDLIDEPLVKYQLKELYLLYVNDNEYLDAEIEKLILLRDN